MGRRRSNREGATSRFGLAQELAEAARATRDSPPSFGALASDTTIGTQEHMMAMRRLAVALILTTLLGGCESSSPPSTSASAVVLPPSVPSDFDMSRAVDIQGVVVWVGPKPEAKAIRGWVPVDGHLSEREFDNPNCLRLHGEADFIEGAIVFLEDVDPHSCGPWIHPPVQVRVDDMQVRTYQGRYLEHQRVGIVRERSVVEFLAMDHGSHVLSLRGADFFGLALPDVEVPRPHQFDQRGIVEISSSTNRPWHRAYLWVSPHPYVTFTNAQGEFRLSMVMPGTYRIGVWHPNSEIVSQDRDPNTGIVTRLRFGPPFVSYRTLQVKHGMAPVRLSLSK